MTVKTRVLALSVVVGGLGVIATTGYGAYSFVSSWGVEKFGEKPWANKRWVERKIASLETATAQSQLYYCQNQNAIIQREVEQVRYESRSGTGQRAPGYAVSYLRVLNDRFEWNNRIIAKIQATGQPVAEQCR